MFFLSNPMKILVPIFLITILGSVSCKQDMKPTYLEESSENKNSTAATPPPNAATSLMPNQIVTPSNQSNPTLVTNPANSAAQNTINTNSNGLNPEHGKPGHRCDIPVGAPLNSKPNVVAKNSPQQIVINPASLQQNPAKNNKPVQKAAPGMNPPHGEPNHRCDIAVGAPLNSPPGNIVTPTQTTTVQSVSAPTPEKALPATVAAPTTPNTDTNEKR